MRLGVRYSGQTIGRGRHISTYRRILAACDLRGDGDRVIGCAALLARSADAELHLAHFVRPLPLVYGGEFPKIMQDVHTGVRREARTRLLEAARVHGVPADHCHVSEGTPAAGIRRLAKELGVGAVVIGTHRRQGLEVFLGSTSNAVLHDYAFDVFAVRTERSDA